MNQHPMAADVDPMYGGEMGLPDEWDEMTEGEKRSEYLALVERYRAAIEAEARRPAPGAPRLRLSGEWLYRRRPALDVRRVVRAVNNIAVRHGVAKDPPRPDWSLMHFYGYTTTPEKMDAEIAAEYERLAALDAAQEDEA